MGSLAKRELGPFACIGHGNGFADAPPASGYQGDFVFQFHFIFLALMFLSATRIVT
jgi:hypothetical protein